MDWGLVVQVRNVSNVRQNEEHHHEGQDAAPWPTIVLILWQSKLHRMSHADVMKKTCLSYSDRLKSQITLEGDDGRLTLRVLHALS